MNNGKYAKFTNGDLVKEISRLKEKKRNAQGKFDVDAINRDLKIIAHILERRKV